MKVRHVGQYGLADRHRHVCGNRLEGEPQIERLLAARQRADQAQRIAAQPERVGRRGGGQAHGEQADQRIEPVGDPQEHARSGRRHGIALETRQIVLVDGDRHVVRLAGDASVFATHDALERGQLDNHLRRQIALEERGGALGDDAIAVIQTKLIGQGRRHRFDPMHLVQHRAELLLERERRQPRREAFQRPRSVSAEEVGCVGIARPDDPLVPLAHDVHVVRWAVADGDEVGE